MSGFVVRGYFNQDPVHCIGGPNFADAAISEEEPRIMADIAEAVKAQAEMVDFGCTDVSIFAVAADGTETRLPSYAEALAELAAAHAALDKAGAGNTVVDLDPAKNRPASLVERLEDIAEALVGTGEALSRLGVPKDGRTLAGRIVALAKLGGAICERGREEFGLSRRRIVVTRRFSDLHAAIDGTGGRQWGCGRSLVEAVGSVVCSHGDVLGIAVVGP